MCGEAGASTPLPPGEGTCEAIRPPPRGELQPAPVAEHLKLLPDLGADVVVVGIEGRQRRLVGIDVVQGELGPAHGLDRLHHGQQPAARVQAGVLQDGGDAHRAATTGGAPAVQHLALGHVRPARNQGDAARRGHLADQDVAPLPARAPRGRRQRLAGLDDVGGEEVTGHHDQAGHSARARVIAHGEQAGIVALRQPPHHRAIGAVGDRPAQPAGLGLQLELLGAGVADEVADGRVVRQLPQPLRAAGRTEQMRGGPALGQGADVLGRAAIDGLLLGEAERARK